MKTIKLYISFLLAIGVFTSCSNEEITKTEDNVNKSLKLVAPQLNYDGLIKQCDKYGPTMYLNFSWDFGTSTSMNIFVDAIKINGNEYVGTWSKTLPNTLNDFSMTIGYPPSGLKDCSFLLPKTKYIFHIWSDFGIPGAHIQLVPDFQDKTSFCICTE